MCEYRRESDSPCFDRFGNYTYPTDYTVDKPNIAIGSPEGFHLFRDEESEVSSDNLEYATRYIPAPINDRIFGLIEDYLRMLEDKREMFEPRTSAWMSVDNDILAIRELCDWLKKEVNNDDE